MFAIIVLQTITGAYTPACLFTANDPVETVTPPKRKSSRLHSAAAGMPVAFVDTLIIRADPDSGSREQMRRIPVITSEFQINAAREGDGK